MENWGIITYKEQYLIGDEDSSHHYDTLEILLTVSHELAHQFFGNVVTCQWWDTLWLNEGFATLFEYLLTEKLYPKTRAQEYFNVNKLQLTLKVDSLESSNSMTFDGNGLYEINYYKGKQAPWFIIIFIGS